MNEAIKGILIIEGADCTGKTTFTKRLREIFPARYMHLRIHKKMEVWHTAGIAIIRGRIGAVEPPIVSRIAVIGNAARRMTMKNDALKRSSERPPRAVADAKASPT